uniref:Calponin-homology (CH) domain-containing protein n=1 Tax=Plectus sambesii TaxID=2011161 RepID=A0A914X3G5_9BILA
MSDRRTARTLTNEAAPTTVNINEGMAQHLEPEETFNDILSSTVVGQTPRSWGMCDLRESAIKGPGPIRSESTSSALNSEGDAGGVALSISPGTNATPSTMRARLALLQSATKTSQGSVTKLRSSKRIDFEATAAAFLQQEEETVGDEENFRRPLAIARANDDAAVPVQREALRPLDVCNTPADNRTFVVPASVPERKALDRPNVTVTSPPEDLERQQRSALTAWLNDILKSNLINDTVTTNAESYMKKSHAEANRHLREILAAAKMTTAVAVPTKEQFSLRVYAEERNLNVLRTRARQLFEKSTVPNEIVRIVNEEKIQVRPDREVYADVGIKVDLLLLLLNFHPLWLRLGLETVFGEAIPLHPETFTVGLTTFIAQRVFTDPLLLQKRNVAHQTVKSLVSKDGGIVLLKHFLTKLCQFLYFVETANQHKLIPQNPCLFLRNSTIKSTEEVLSKISRDLISGSGNLPKVLGRVGYKATYKQGFFEEYHFVVNSLTDGLTDGIVLAKIVELLTDQPDKIMSRLRNPMNDRLRKVNNVEMVLTAARAAGIETGDVKPEMIVAGHKEATLELVWRLVGVYMVVQAEGGTAAEVRRASLTIESWSTRRLSAIQTPMDFEEQRITRGVVRIQALARGFLGRRHFEHLKIERIEAVRRAAQLAEEAERLRVEAERYTRKLTKAAIVIQTAARALLARRQLRQLREEERLRLVQWEADRLAEQQRRVAAVIVLQSAFRGLCARRELKRLREAKLEYERKIEEQRRLRAAIRIQTAVRCMFARWELQRLRAEKAESDRLLEEQRRWWAAVRIQSAVRAWFAWRELQLLKELRRIRLLEEEAARLAEQQRRTEAVIILQSALRGTCARRQLQQLKIAKAEADRLLEEQRRVRAAICIQTAVRCMLARRELSHLKAAKVERDRLIEEQRRWQAAICIQSAVRGLLARRQLEQLKELKRLRLLEEEAARLAVLQRRTEAAIILQSALRGMQARRQLQQLKVAKMEAEKVAAERRRGRAAIQLQTAVRCMLARRKLVHLKAAKLEKERQMEEQRRRHAAIVLQSVTRGMFARRELKCLKVAKLEHDRKMEVQRRQKACVSIQVAVRAMLARRQLKKLRAAKLEADRKMEEQRFLRATVRIQSATRSMFARRELQQLKELKRIRILQEEAKRLAEQQRLNAAVVVLQSAFRGTHARRELKHLREIKLEADRLLEEQRRLRAAIIIQTAVRGLLARLELKRLKAAKVESDRLLAEQRRLRAAICIQSAVRGMFARRELQQLKELKRIRLLEEEAARLVELQRRTEAAIVLQSALRGMCARRQLQQFKIAKVEADRLAAEKLRMRATIRLQTAVRCMLARRELNHLKAAKVERDRLIEEERRLQAAICIQSAMRGLFARRQLEQLKELKRLKLLEEEAARLAEERRIARAATILQTTVRGLLARRELSRLRAAKIEADRIIEAQRQSRAAVRIQAWLRGMRSRRALEAVMTEVRARMAAWQLAVETEEARTRPIIDRVRDCLPDLLSDSLYRRKKAAYFLERATHWSSQCSLYVVANQGVPIVFDCLDELNRGEGSAEVFLPLMQLLVTLTKCRLIANEMIAERKVVIERGLHYWHAFHNKPEVNILCANMLTNLAKLANIKKEFIQFKGPWYVDQLKKKFSRLPPTDLRVIALSQLVGVIQKM